jgi:hypothetical protein
MISVVIPTLNDEAVLARALQPLVAAAIGGLVSEVIVVDAGSTDATLDIADDSGCRIVQAPADGSSGGRWSAGQAAARRDWILQLEPMAWLPPAWDEAARDHMERHPGRAAIFPAAREGLLGRLGMSGRAHKALLAPRSWFGTGTWPRRLPMRLIAPSGRRAGA